MRQAFAERLLAEPEVAPVGLGARDSLRLEAGLCLYGHDIDETTTPVEADLAWTIGKRRREEGGFSGAATILRQLARGAARRRVGIRPDGRAPAREGTAILDSAGNPIGRVTSGGFGPSLGAPIAMGYVDAAHAAREHARGCYRARRQRARRMSPTCRLSRTAITAPTRAQRVAIIESHSKSSWPRRSRDRGVEHSPGSLVGRRGRSGKP